MHPSVSALLADLLAGLQTTLAQQVQSVYLYGSLAWGDFDPAISNIDVVVVLETPITPPVFTTLDDLHQSLVATFPEWEGRIEIAYMTVEALRTFRDTPSEIGIISPGEPFHMKEAGRDWLLNWYFVQEKGQTLWGAPPAAWITPPITRAEFVQAVRDQVMAWSDWVYTMPRRGQQAYVILTLCRALYSLHTGDQTSKLQAALWAQKAYPQWAEVIGNALNWREWWREENGEGQETFAETLRFLAFVQSESR